MCPEVEYLGHIISASGLHPTQEKVKALKDAPTPTSVSQLKSFLDRFVELLWDIFA